jgi:hypothetical protein
MLPEVVDVIKLGVESHVHVDEHAVDVGEAVDLIAFLLSVKNREPINSNHVSAIVHATNEGIGRSS